MGDLLTFSIEASCHASGRRGGRVGCLRGTSAAHWYELGCQLEASANGGQLDRDARTAAVAAYERAIAGNPELADAHNNLGRLHVDGGAPVIAESCFRLAICADAGVALYWFNLGVSVEDQGRHGEAIAAYERAIEIDPASTAAADANYNLARLLELSGRRAGDEATMRRAVRHLLRYRQLTKSKPAALSAVR